MSMDEWFAAIDGYMDSIGAEKPIAPATSNDFPELDKYAGPSESIIK